MLGYVKNVRKFRLFLGAIVLLPALSLAWLICQSSAFTMPALFLFCALAAPAFVAFLYARPMPAESCSHGGMVA